MFHDDSMKSFFRRLSFTPDGSLLLTPGRLHWVQSRGLGGTLRLCCSAQSAHCSLQGSSEKALPLVSPLQRWWLHWPGVGGSAFGILKRFPSGSDVQRWGLARLSSSCACGSHEHRAGWGWVWLGFWGRGGCWDRMALQPTATPTGAVPSPQRLVTPWLQTILCMKVSPRVGFREGPGQVCH